MTFSVSVCATYSFYTSRTPEKGWGNSHRKRNGLLSEIVKKKANKYHRYQESVL